MFAGQFDPQLRRPGFESPISFDLEEVADELQILLIVFDDQNKLTRHGIPPTSKHMTLARQRSVRCAHVCPAGCYFSCAWRTLLYSDSGAPVYKSLVACFSDRVPPASGPPALKALVVRTPGPARRTQSARTYSCERDM